MEEEKHSLKTIYTLIIFFVIYSILGWILETIYSFCVLGEFTKRGFLFGPVCPIYGYGAIILILLLKKYDKQYIKLFFLSIIIFSILEYSTSFILEVLFSMKWWDYSNDILNLNGRISLFYSLAWGIVAMIFVKFHPFLEKQVNKLLQKISDKFQVFFVYLSFFIYFCDTVLSCINYLKV